jgi:hypothetical protein
VAVARSAAAFVGGWVPILVVLVCVCVCVCDHIFITLNTSCHIKSGVWGAYPCKCCCPEP